MEDHYCVKSKGQGKKENIIIIDEMRITILTEALIRVEYNRNGHFVDLPSQVIWNRTLFPKPEVLLQWLHDHNLKVSLNVHPALGVRAYESSYHDMALAIGMDPDKEEAIEFDMTNPKFVEAYFKYLHWPLEQMGVDFWWIDWQQGNRTKREGLDPLWLLNHYHFLDNQKKGNRGMILSRFAGFGSQRYPVGFSGDTVISWDSLQFQPYFTSTASNVGYCWWSHDIGGHMKGIYDEELQIRWVQFGVFSPIFRLHCSSSPFNHKEPWNYTISTEEVLTNFMRLRHRLIPYLYTMNECLSRDGNPLIQPMYYEYSESKEAYEKPNEYLFGSGMICHPITSKSIDYLHMGKVETWIPEGTYVDWFTGLIYKGEKQIVMYRGMKDIPVLLKAGSIVPLAGIEGKVNFTQNPFELEVIITAGKDGSFILYEDDGISIDEKERKAVRTLFELDYSQNGRFVIHKSNGDLSVIPEFRSYQLRFLGFEKPEHIMTRMDGVEQELEYDYDEYRNEVILPAMTQSTSNELVVTFVGGMRFGANKIVDRIFHLLDQVSIDHLLKERIFDVIREQIRENILKRLSLENLPKELLYAIQEVIEAEEE